MHKRIERHQNDRQDCQIGLMPHLLRAIQKHLNQICFALFALVFLFASARTATAQAAYSFGSLAIGVSSVQTVPVTLRNAGVIGEIKILTQGSPNLDFTPSGNYSNCPSFPVQTCVPVNFAPKSPGVRSGAIVILDTTGLILATQPLSGVGTGPLSVMAPGEISSVAGDQTLTTLQYPDGVATDAAGRLYISDTFNHRIQRVDPGAQGSTATIAGTGTAGLSGDGGPATAAQINTPGGILIDGAGNVFFADTENNAVREINAVTGTISTIAGTLGTSGYSGDGGVAVQAQLAAPKAFTFDSSNNVYISDTGNNAIRRVDAATGIITTIAGGPVGGFDQPWGITVGPDGSIYIADFANNRVRKIDSVTGTLSTVAGTGVAGATGDGGDAVAAKLYHPSDVVTDPAGNLYISDTENNCIRKVNQNRTPAIISTLVGNGLGLGHLGDGFNANLAIVAKPLSIYLDGTGNLFIADSGFLLIRKVSGTTGGIEFPDMNEGKISLPIAQVVENDGNAPLTFSNLAVTPPTAKAQLDVLPTDPITTTCSTSATLAIGASCSLAIEFAPQILGTTSVQTGVLSVASDSANSPIAVNLTGLSIALAPSATTVTSALNPAPVGQNVTFVAKITSTHSVTGTVQFLKDGTNLEGPQGIVSNAASLITTFDAPGQYNITAVYSGDNANAGSTSNSAVVQIIQQVATTNLQVTPTTFQMQTKQHTTLTITLTSTSNVSDTFSLGCLGLPPGATCTFSNNNPTLPAGGTSTISLAVDSGTPLQSGTQAYNEPSTTHPLRIFAGFLPGGLLLCLLSLGVRYRKGAQSLRNFLLLLSLAGVISSLSGCGTIQINGTSPGTYNFQVTAHGQSGSTQSVGVTMTITQ